MSPHPQKSDIQFKCVVAYAKDKCPLPVYVDITLVTDIYLNTIQTIEFGKSIVPHTADVNYTVCNSDVYIIGTVVYVTDPPSEFSFQTQR